MFFYNTFVCPYSTLWGRPVLCERLRQLCLILAAFAKGTAEVGWWATRDASYFACVLWRVFSCENVLFFSSVITQCISFFTIRQFERD